ncbi:CCB2 [Auxenochlorella protothecoides x Auxenochlorella symbiontica]
MLLERVAWRPRMAIPHTSSRGPRQTSCPRRAAVLICASKRRDVDMMRFTLGIPGFDDAQIPRIIGLAGGSLLIANHVLGSQPTPLAQTLAEVLGLALASLAFAIPNLDAWVNGGKQAASATIADARNVFSLAEDLSEDAKVELAWASYVLLLNTGIAGLGMVAGDRILLLRGQVAGTAPALEDGAGGDWRAQTRGADAGHGDRPSFVPASMQNLLVKAFTTRHGQAPSRLYVWTADGQSLPPNDIVWLDALVTKLARAL